MRRRAPSPERAEGSRVKPRYFKAEFPHSPETPPIASERLDLSETVLPSPSSHVRPMLSLVCVFQDLKFFIKRLLKTITDVCTPITSYCFLELLFLK